MCNSTSYAGYFPPIYNAVPNTTIDSPAAMSAVLEAGGSRFLDQYPAASVEYVLGDEVYPEWEVILLSVCVTGSPPESAVAGPVFMGDVNAITGAVVYAENSSFPGGNGSGQCSTTMTIAVGATASPSSGLITDVRPAAIVSSDPRERYRQFSAAGPVQDRRAR
jgi:hypothetical protein